VQAIVSVTVGTGDGDGAAAGGRESRKKVRVTTVEGLF